MTESRRRRRGLPSFPRGKRGRRRRAFWLGRIGGSWCDGWLCNTCVVVSRIRFVYDIVALCVRGPRARQGHTSVSNHRETVFFRTNGVAWHRSPFILHGYVRTQNSSSAAAFSLIERRPLPSWNFEISNSHGQ